MQDEKLTLLLHRFAVASIAHYQALEEMDEERANAHARIITGLYRSIIAAGEGGRQAMLELTDDTDPVVAGMAAVYSIRYDSTRCLTTLIRVAQEPSLLGFRASVAVERWNNGEWQGPEE